MIVFSAISLFIVSLLIKGFIVKQELISFVITTVSLAIVYYLATPFLKLVLLPLNIITVGLVSIAAYIILFHYVISYFNFVIVKPWVFQGLQLYSFTIPKLSMNYLTTLIISSILYAFIINILELLT